MAIIVEEKENLIRGKHLLSALGYNCEIGAQDLFVYLPSDAMDNVRKVESDLGQTAGCRVWVIGV